MEFEVGDLIIATKLDRERNSYINGDIIQIIKKHSHTYDVKIIHKVDNPNYIGSTTWGLSSECKYFERM